MNGSRTISISEELYLAAESRFAHRFGSVDEIVAELLRQMLRDESSQMDEREQRILEERLKALGYI